MSVSTMLMKIKEKCVGREVGNSTECAHTLIDNFPPVCRMLLYLGADAIGSAFLQGVHQGGLPSIVPTAIATPTITILIPIIHMPTTIIPLAATTRVRRDFLDREGALREKAATAVSTATAVVRSAVVVAVVVDTAVAVAAAVRWGDIIDLVLASSGSSPAPRPPGFIWPLKLGADAVKAVAQNLGLNPGLNGRLLQLGQGLKQFRAKEEK